MLLLSHRGYHASAPENTFEAFELAVAMGADGIETDVRVSADGQALLHHDRIARNRRPISSLTYAELAAATPYRVPTLEEAVARWPDIFWNLEIKSPAAAEPIARVVERHPGTRFLVSSFWHPVIDELSEKLPVDLGVLVAHCSTELPVPLSWLEENPRVKAVVWCYEWLDRRRLQQVADCDLQNFVYGVETAEEHEALLDLPVHAVITDHLDLGRPRKGMSRATA